MIIMFYLFFRKKRSQLLL